MVIIIFIAIIVRCGGKVFHAERMLSKKHSFHKVNHHYCHLSHCATVPIYLMIIISSYPS